MNKDQLERIQKIVTPVVIGVTVAAAAVASFVQIRRETMRRRRWALPVAIIGALVLAGVVGAAVEYAVESQPRLSCIDGTFTNDRGVVTCRAVLSTGVPAGATARCADGTYSFNRSASDICSRHGGISVAL